LRRQFPFQRGAESGIIQRVAREKGGDFHTESMLPSERKTRFPQLRAEGD
jgi:hypothetical protein